MTTPFWVQKPGVTTYLPGPLTVTQSRQVLFGLLARAESVDTTRVVTKAASAANCCMFMVHSSCEAWLELKGSGGEPHDRSWLSHADPWRRARTRERNQ